MIEKFSRHTLAIDASSAQHLAPPTEAQRFEGVDFSPSGEILGVASADTNAVWLFRRGSDQRFEDEPFSKIGGLSYPHDLSFAACGDRELLAVAQRQGAIAVFARRLTDESYADVPALTIEGAESRLDYSDGVAFVPPHSDYLAACNLTRGTVSFYPRRSAAAADFATIPEFELSHSSLCEPDGLAFSPTGALLATANHGSDTISIFRRDEDLMAEGVLRYLPEPETVIQDAHLRFPHSLAFTADGGHLFVTNAGANYFSVYEILSRTFGWPGASVRHIVNSETVFHAVNARNKKEGGPKGVATFGHEFAVCSPEFGVRIYPFR